MRLLQLLRRSIDAPAAPFVAAALLCLSVASLQAAYPPSLAEARQHFEAQRWEDAARAYRHLANHPEAEVGGELTPGEAWFYLGQSLRLGGDPDAALDAYEKALEEGFNRLHTLARLAMTHGLRGDIDAALATLDDMLASGFAPEALGRLAHLDSVRADPRYAALVAEAAARAHPCEHDERYRALDFWLGEWELVSQGQTLGTDSIQRATRGCAVLQHFLSGAGSEGRSLSYLDPETGTWHQHWIGSGGAVVWMEGKPAEGGIVFETVERPGAAAPSPVTRTYYRPREDGTVGMTIDTLQEDGETWNTTFQAVYQPRSDPEM